MVRSVNTKFFFSPNFIIKIVLGALVHYVDYGNKAISTDLRQLPDNLKTIQHLAVHCCLESKNGVFSSQMAERFANLSRDIPLELEYVSKNSSPAIVKLFENGVLFGEPTETKIPSETLKLKAYITERIAPNHFYIQLNNDMEEAMTSAFEFPVLEESCKCAGKLCAALWEGAFYRAEILAVNEEGNCLMF